MADIPRFRTIPGCIRELQRQDGSTAYTLRALRRATNAGEIPFLQIGNKRLVDLNKLFEILSNPKEPPAPGEHYGEVRKIGK